MKLIIFLVISTVFLLSVEIVKRKFSISSSTTRRISHVGAASIAAVSPLFIDKYLIILVCLGFAVSMFISRKLSLFSSIHLVNRKTLGEVFLPLGEAISAVIFLPHAIMSFQYGILVMGFSDAIAGYVGEKFGKHPLVFFNNRKSIEGSLTFFFVTLIITTIFNPSLGLHLIIVPITLTIMEFFLGYGSDNLIIPAVSSYLFMFFYNAP